MGRFSLQRSGAGGGRPSTTSNVPITVISSIPSVVCEQLLGTISPPEAPDESIDLLDIAWYERGKRSLNRQSRGGRSLRILLPAKEFLDHGAVLWEGGATKVVANLLPCEVMSIRSSSPAELARIAYVIGNIHLPAEILEGEICIPASDANEAALVAAGIAYTLDFRRIGKIADPLPHVGLFSL